MPQASDSTAWMGECLSLTDGLGVMLLAALAAALASVLVVALVAVAHSRLEQRPKRRPQWYAGVGVAALAGLIAASMNASRGTVVASVAGAVIGAWQVRGYDLIQRPCLVALLGSAMGFSVMSWGFVRYLSSSMQANVARVELYVAVFIGALLFATSATAFCKLRGTLPLKAVERPAHGIVNLFAILLCGWLGYGFATEQAQPFGLAALLAMSALASAIRVIHVRLRRTLRWPRVGRQAGFAGAYRMARRGRADVGATRNDVRQDARGSMPASSGVA
jgi:NAD(P) transhydrogenase subunit beta